MKKITLFLIVLLSFLVFSENDTFAQDDSYNSLQEEIIEYETIVHIKPDASLYVIENITVNALNDEIKRGIYRDFPTKYETEIGLNSNTSFIVKEVLKNGEPEPYFTQSVANGVRLYVGDSDVIISPGVYKYSIAYETDRQITYFDGSDGLLYNMTGNGWVFPIKHSSAEIHIPAELSEDQITYNAFWGPQGSDNSEKITSEVINEDGVTVVKFDNQNVLNSYEGLTAGVVFPEGIVQEYTKQDAVEDLVKDNLLGVLMILLSLGFVGTSVILMVIYGSDPEGKAIYPQYEIPEDLSPGLARYIDKMGYDNKIITSTVVSLGSKGWVDMVEEKKRFGKSKYVLNLVKSKPKISNKEISVDEIAFIDEFFPIGLNSINFSGKYDPVVKSAVDSFKAYYAGMRHQYITNNGQIYGPFIFLAILIPAALMFLGLVVFQRDFSILVIPAILLIILSILPLPFVLKNRTLKGREMQDTIEGLKMFITATEKEKIKIMHNNFPKDMDTFNKYFPYAMALGLETKWMNQFKSVIDKAQIENRDGTYSYGWYTGTRAFNSSNFGSGLNSAMVGTIAASSTPPSQSGGRGGWSGGGGGGFSGGGGGGGGGGGW